MKFGFIQTCFQQIKNSIQNCFLSKFGDQLIKVCKSPNKQN